MLNKKTILAPFEKGVNFSQWLEARTLEDVRTDMFTRQDFANAKKLGCDVVRVPIHFERFCDAAAGYPLPDKLTGILDNIAAWAEELQLYVVFDFHNNTHGDSFTSPDVETVLTPIWTQLANRYKDATEYIVYELMNEPHGIDVALWNEIIARVFKVVRGIDQKHWIIVGGADWNSAKAMKTLPDFQDDKVIYTFHFYDPHTFTHQGAVWCHMERVMGLPFPYDADKMPPLPENPTEDEQRRFRDYARTGQLSAVTDCFDEYAAFSLERNAPIYCGEFGCFMTVPEETRVAWYRIVTDLLEARGIARTSWDYYGGFGVFNRGQRGMKPQFPQDLNRPLLAALGLNADVQ